jgi:O-antigen ligase
MVADRPFLGHGWWFGNDEMLPYYRLHPDIPLIGAQAGLHNVYLFYAVALGLVGLALWSLAVALVFGRALSVRGPPESVPWQIGLKAALAAWLVIGIFGPANYAFPTAVVWTWAGIVWPAWRPVPVPDEAEAPTRRRPLTVAAP